MSVKVTGSKHHKPSSDAMITAVVFNPTEIPPEKCNAIMHYFGDVLSAVMDMYELPGIAAMDTFFVIGEPGITAIPGKFPLSEVVAKDFLTLLAREGL